MLKRLNANKKQKLLRDETNELLTASQDGDLEIVSKFIRNNFNINSKNENGLTALHLASKEGHTEVIRELLKRGADVNSTTKRGNGALHMACVGGKLEGVRILLENGADVNSQSENGFTPLYIAAQENHMDLVKFLLDHGANATLKTDDSFLPLDIALQQGNGKVVESLVENDPSNKASLPALHVASRNNDVRLAKFLLENGNDVNRPSTSGFTALHIGARYGNLDVCQLLIDKGADVNFKAKNDITALHVCSKEGRSALVDLLLSHGADPNSQTTEGLTAVHCAAVSGHDQALDSLARNGALLGLKTKTGLTPLHMALQSNQLSCTRQLLQYNAPIDDPSEDKLTPLHVAAHCGNLRSAQILLEAGCDVNAKAKNGFSPLHVACKKNHKELVKQLLQYNASINQASDSGILPVHVAAFMGHTDIMTSLIQNGANLNAPTGGGMTPVYLAALANRTEAIELLLQKGADVDAKTAEQRTALHVASELGNSSNVVCLLQHGASPHIMTTDRSLPLDLATRSGHEDVVQLLCDHGAVSEEGKSFQKTTPSSTASALEEFSTVREAMKYIRDENDGLKTPVAKQKTLSEFGRPSTSRSKTRDLDSRLSQTHSSLALPGSPSASFWSSFLADARGGEMIGCRHSGVRVILPPSKIPNPIGIRCKLIRKEKLPFPPLLREGEGLACRALETAPAGSKFLGPVIFEVPHFACLRNEEREIVILRSDNGKSWTEHLSPSLDGLEPVLKNSLLSEMRRQTNSALMRIVTVDLPHFFTLVSRIRMKREEFSVDGGSLSATLTPKVKITFPPESFRRNTKVGLQAQPVSQVAVSKAFGDESCVSPIVTIEPRRRKFRSPVSVTMPLPENEAISAQNTRLLCSLSDGKTEDVWEDISDLTPLTVVRDLVSFTTSVSGKYWLLSSPKVDLSDVQKLYSVTIPVPYFSRFVIFAKRLSASEGQLRIFCMTDDRVDKTLERQEQFIEVARSDDVEVLDGTAVYIHLDGNLLPLNSSPDDQLHLNFHAFRENRLPLAVRVVNPDAEASAHVTFTRDHVTTIPEPSDAISTLRVTLPSFDDGKSPEKIRSTPVFQADESKAKDDEPELLKAELRLADVAELIGARWKQVAERLGIPLSDVDLIESDYDDPTEQALSVLQQWMDENGSRANGNSLEKALRELGMDDIITSCMINVADVTDAEEKAAAKSYLDAGVDPLKTEMGSARDLGSSSDSETIRHSLSPDDAYEEIELRKAGILLPSEGRKTSNEDNNRIEEMEFRERFPFMDRSVSTVSTNTLTTLPSDGDDAQTLIQSTDDISGGSSDQTIVKAEANEEETLLEDGSSVSRRVVTVKHFKRCDRGSDDLQLALVEMNEDITVLPPGVTLPLEEGDGVVLETDVDNSEELLDNGVLLVHKVTRTKVIKAVPSGENDAPSQGTDPLPSENSSVETLSAASSPSSEGLLSVSASSSSSSSAPREAMDTRIPVEGVPVEEEELTEEKSGQTFRSSPWTSPSKWNTNDRSAAEESRETFEEIEGSCDFLVHERPSTEVITCKDEEKADREEEDTFKHSSVILRRRVHKKTLLTAGCQEQTIVTEDTQVEQDNEAPKELSSAIQQIIEQFVHGKNSFVTCYNAC